MDKKSGKKNRKENNKNTSKTKTTDKPVSKKISNEIPEKTVVVQNSIIEFSDEIQDVLQISQPVENKFKKREIQSNWSKYEAPIDDDDDPATDFENLIQAPISVGGHFKFKSEKLVEHDIMAEYGDYFKLNIDKLAENLETLPFYKRHELDEVMFNTSEIKTMNSKCTLIEADCANKIMNILSKTDNSVNKSRHALKSIDLTKSIQELSLKDTKSQTNVHLEKENDKMNHEDDIDELLELKSPAKITDDTEIVSEILSEPELKNVLKPVPINSKTNLENWLDDLLQ